LQNLGDGGATRPLPRDGGIEELHGDPTVGPRPQGLDQRSKMEEAVPKINYCINVSPSQRNGAVPAPLFGRWAEMARQLPRWARPSGRPPIVCKTFDSSICIPGFQSPSDVHNLL